MYEQVKEQIKSLRTARDNKCLELSNQIHDAQYNYRLKLRDVLEANGLTGLVRHTETGIVGWIGTSGKSGNYLEFFPRTKRGNASVYPTNDIYPVDVTEFEPVKEV